MWGWQSVGFLIVLLWGRACLLIRLWNGSYMHLTWILHQEECKDLDPTSDPGQCMIWAGSKPEIRPQWLHSSNNSKLLWSVSIFGPIQKILRTNILKMSDKNQISIECKIGFIAFYPQNWCAEFLVSLGTDWHALGNYPSIVGSSTYNRECLNVSIFLGNFLHIQHCCIDPKLKNSN